MNILLKYQVCLFSFSIYSIIIIIINSVEWLLNEEAFSDNKTARFTNIKKFICLYVSTGEVRENL